MLYFLSSWFKERTNETQRLSLDLWNPSSPSSSELGIDCEDKERIRNYLDVDQVSSNTTLLERKDDKSLFTRAGT